MNYDIVTGMIVCLLSAYVSGFFNYLTGIGAKDMAVFYAPVVEEIMKLLPLLFYIFVFEPDPGRLFAASVGIGLGFATFENCCYILSSGASEVTYILIRGMAVGVMHLICPDAGNGTEYGSVFQGTFNIVCCWCIIFVNDISRVI